MVKPGAQTHRERDLSQTFGALDVEAVDLNAQIRLTKDVLFASVELFAAVNVLATSGASHVEGRHKTDHELAILFTLNAWNFGRIEVRRIVFLEEFSPNITVSVVTFTKK